MNDKARQDSLAMNRGKTRRHVISIKVERHSYHIDLDVRFFDQMASSDPDSTKHRSADAARLGFHPILGSSAVVTSLSEGLGQPRPHWQ